MREDGSSIPAHIAIVMDGNGRWAKARGRPRTIGHRAGARAVNRCIDWCVARGVGALTLFAFSSENWNRPAEEVGTLMQLFLRALDREVDDLGRLVRQDPEREEQVRPALLVRHRLQAAREVTLAEAEDPEDPPRPRPERVAQARAEERLEALEHRPHLGRHAGEADHQRPPEIEREARGDADRVVDDRRARRHLGLAELDLVACVTASREACGDRLDRRGRSHAVDARRGGHGGGCEIVTGRSEPPGDHAEVGPERVLKRADDRRLAVGDRNRTPHRHPPKAEEAGDIRGIRVQGVAREELITDANDLG